ncbi:hypothetical protein JOC77_000368 [Peribacillus deserti]|uniref:Uncharacterized protein n=1 Tax=Peribacillus deserti TaxID=673318 RepID=A0ABS2QCS3_9BACI|nr:hypothetical protein [Peribacillus deserti]MBM7690965.1 hypothetical protein [Peribacillus deserti]
MSTEQKQELFMDILKNAYEASTAQEGITLQEMMERLEGDLSGLISK